jgi:hypothetical protein
MEIKNTNRAAAARQVLRALHANLEPRVSDDTLIPAMIKAGLVRWGARTLEPTDLGSSIIKG